MLNRYVNRIRERFNSNTICIRPETLVEPKGDVLLSYITAPFRKTHTQRTIPHSNYWECREIAQIWALNGYTVRIIDWDDQNFIPDKDYSFFIDIHSNMERIAPKLSDDCVNILHITGSHWLFQNQAEYSRLYDLYLRRGVALKPRRIVKPSRGIEFADYVTIIGNDYTSRTFGDTNVPFYSLPVTTTVKFPWIERDYSRIKNNFIWLGSDGLVHKGLDLVLEAFSDMPECNLTVFGPVNTESDFSDEYNKELFHLDNVTTVGWIDVNSTKFFEYVRNSIGIIYPSCSEGQAGSVATCMHAGLIPIVSQESGFNTDGLGITLKQNTIEEIQTAIQLIVNSSNEKLRKLSLSCYYYSNKIHTRENFSLAYKNIVAGLLVDKGKTEAEY